MVQSRVMLVGSFRYELVKRHESFRHCLGRWLELVRQSLTQEVDLLADVSEPLATMGDRGEGVCPRLS